MARPLIGVTSSFGRNEAEPRRLQSHLLAGYTDGVFAVGGMPQAIPVPPEYDDALLDELLARYDGLIFTGGRDLNPRHFGQQPHERSILLHPRRDAFELDLFRRADAKRIPIFAICLGHQVAHVARGGRLIQHVDDLQLSPAVCHHLANDENAFHDAEIESDSRLAQIVGRSDPGECKAPLCAPRIEVNSRHHQIVDGKHLGVGLRTVAVSADGVVEASEDMDGRFLLTVQWHPEDLLDRAEHVALFAAVVEEAGRYRRD